jgi:hypothetical protein
MTLGAPVIRSFTPNLGGDERDGRWRGRAEVQGSWGPAHALPYDRSRQSPAELGG